MPIRTGATSAAEVADPTTGLKFLTSSLPDDPTKCHNVPLLIAFLADKPAGAVQITPLSPNTLDMEVTFKDLKRLPSALRKTDSGSPWPTATISRVLPAPSNSSTEFSHWTTTR